MVTPPSEFAGHTLTVDGITSRQGVFGDSIVGVSHVNRIFTAKDDHANSYCGLCSGVAYQRAGAMRWTADQPIIRFTSNGLETAHYGQA